MPEAITVVLTSCGRWDLLAKTIESFEKFNTYPIERKVIIEDGPMPTFNFKGWEVMATGKRLGQVKAIDKAYQTVTTDFIFHLEDDWEFYREGFIEESLPILIAYPKIITVWLRDLADTNGHPTVIGEKDFRYLSTAYNWKGFTWNPGLRRLSDYKRIGSYGKHTSFNNRHPGISEFKIGQLYWRLNYKAAILKKGYVRHIGNNRHVN